MNRKINLSARFFNQLKKFAGRGLSAKSGEGAMQKKSYTSSTDYLYQESIKTNRMFLDVLSLTR
ncbi:MAG: hypothetical protein FWB97_05970 [Oscillospiraceae bacterium]|nr:hypothetical protein [Oscillospiraceae bacterium]